MARSLVRWRLGIEDFFLASQGTRDKYLMVGVKKKHLKSLRLEIGFAKVCVEQLIDSLILCVASVSKLCFIEFSLLTRSYSKGVTQAAWQGDVLRVGQAVCQGQLALCRGDELWLL